MHASDLPDLPATPKALTRDQQFLAAVCDRLDRNSVLLAQVLNRMPAQASAPDVAGEVELREPAAPLTAASADEPSAKPAAAPRPRGSTGKAAARARKPGGTGTPNSKETS